MLGVMHQAAPPSARELSGAVGPITNTSARLPPPFPRTEDSGVQCRPVISGFKELFTEMLYPQSLQLSPRPRAPTVSCSASKVAKNASTSDAFASAFLIASNMSVRVANDSIGIV
jgi:hypothetical protein